MKKKKLKKLVEKLLRQKAKKRRPKPKPKQKPPADVLPLMQKVRRQLEELRKPLPTNVNFTVVNNTAGPITPTPEQQKLIAALAENVRIRLLRVTPPEPEPTIGEYRRMDLSIGMMSGAFAGRVRTALGELRHPPSYIKLTKKTVASSPTLP